MYFASIVRDLQSHHPALHDGNLSAADGVALPGRSVLGDAIHFVLRGLHGSSFTDVANQEMQHPGCSGSRPQVSVTLTFQLPAPAEQDAVDAAAGQPTHLLELTRSCSSSRSSAVQMRDQHGSTRSLSEVTDRLRSNGYWSYNA